MNAGCSQQVINNAVELQRLNLKFCRFMPVEKVFALGRPVPNRSEVSGDVKQIHMRTTNFRLVDLSQL